MIGSEIGTTETIATDDTAVIEAAIELIAMATGTEIVTGIIATVATTATANMVAAATATANMGAVATATTATTPTR